jgi:hypothetical protein
MVYFEKLNLMSHYSLDPETFKCNDCKMNKQQSLRDWNDLQEILGRFLTPEHNKGRARHAFRGLDLKEFHLTTSLQRTGADGKHAAAVETPIFRNFKKYAHRDFGNEEPFLHWLSVAQHHNLPTRILDWTVSPTVALHFATSDLTSLDKDGALWAVDYLAANSLLSPVLRGVLEEHDARILTVDLIKNKIEKFSDLKELAGNDVYAMFFEPSAIDDQIVNQYALFSVMPMPETIMCDWLEQQHHLYNKFVIPGDLKPEIRDRLDQMNVTERVMFPGLDGTAKWLKRHYFYRKAAPK